MSIYNLQITKKDPTITPLYSMIESGDAEIFIPKCRWHKDYSEMAIAKREDALRKLRAEKSFKKIKKLISKSK